MKQTKHKWIEIGPRTNVAGTQYADLKHIRGLITLGSQLRFIGQPSNPYDAQAIKVMFDVVHIGYVPKDSELKLQLWEHHRAGNRLIAVVTGLQLNYGAIDFVQFQALALAPSAKLTKAKADVLFSRMKEELSYQIK